MTYFILAYMSGLRGDLKFCSLPVQVQTKMANLRNTQNMRAMGLGQPHLSLINIPESLHLI